MSTIKVQRVLLWTAVVGISLFALMIILGDFLPPPSANMTDDQLVAFWANDVELKRVALILGCASLAGFFICLNVVWFQQIRRIEGPAAPLGYLVLILGAVFVIPGALLPCLVWSPLVYRTGLGPDTVRVLNDIGWFSFFTPAPTCMQYVVIASCVFRDSEQRVFPRWFAYVCLWVALLFLPGGFVYFWKDGPLAWDGLITWWIALGAAVIWVNTLFFVLFRAIRGQELEEAGARAAGSSPGGADSGISGPGVGIPA